MQVSALELLIVREDHCHLPMALLVSVARRKGEHPASHSSVPSPRQRQGTTTDLARVVVVVVVIVVEM
ncbi:hypothetical protein E2C01_044291 [Portunus trituberculatus]|uniref:Uncharacterized protein n=1 Tax=Portunus trituberculatus TaxID=210409 RepID=A0A5B7FV88_PORTR|nr:hypothetical protein [Portunus trituberculatus]